MQTSKYVQTTFLELNDAVFPANNNKCFYKYKMPCLAIGQKIP